MKYVILAMGLLFIFPTDISALKTYAPRLVVQQNGQALVTELRSLTLLKGEGAVLLPDLPSTIDPNTCKFAPRPPRAISSSAT